MALDDNQTNLFGGDSFDGETPEHHSGEGGSTPTSPLQISPKEIRLARISMALADSYSIRRHYLHRTAKNSKLALGVFVHGEMYGIMIWGLPVAPLKNQFGNRWTQLELRRMFLSDQLPKNSESRCLAVCTRLIASLFPNCRKLIAYSDLSHGHKGGIYKAAGWTFAGRIEPDEGGGWAAHERHKRVEFGAKYKWEKWIPEK